jgi:anti-sigma factor RsiW
MIMLVRRRNDLVCQEVVELVSDYLEGALSRADRRRFKAHLRKCPNCTNYLEQMRATIRATGSLHPDDLTPEVRQEFTELFRRWRDEGS